MQAAFDRISQDDRHIGIRKLASGQVSHRLFGRWAMHHDPARSVIWTEKEISDGVVDSASTQDSIRLFEALSGKIKDEPLE